MTTFPELHLIRSRQAARRAHPEPHQRLTAAARSAEAFSQGTPIDVELEIMLMVVDIGRDTLVGLEIGNQVAPQDITNATRVLTAARDVMARTSSDHEYLEQFSQLYDELFAMINHLNLGDE